MTTHSTRTNRKATDPVTAAFLRENADPDGPLNTALKVAGWETPPPRWRRALESVDVSGAVVQERARTRPEPVLDPATGRTEDWRTVWSLFLTPDGHAGTYARALPAHAGAVVGMGADQRACTAHVFTYPAPPAPECPTAGV
ncbi:hypothetical protein [Streptomyces sp. SLBN-118]|uniref:hypothetical protein n=1 Tax=Streptomyces sp. SLBN-118 TaxID=2768454 RepID=UPI0013594807|nr:hypothetical protein [Streptomyces sp. SLBN-118]